MQNRERLSSRLGFILLSADCAIGCGNVWKFPWMTGQYGGGGFGTPALGKNNLSHLIFFNVCRTVGTGSMVYALDKVTGEEVWSQPIDHQSISSPIAMYEPDGRSYLVMGDDSGTLRLMDGYTGSTIHTVNLGSAIHASPAAYGNKVVVGTTGGMLYFVEVK